MKRYAISLLALLFVAAPCNAQFLKKLEQEFSQNQTGGGALGGLSSLLPGANNGGGQVAGTTSLPQGQYTMTNMQTGQAYYVLVNQSGQMFASLAPAGQNPMNAQQYLNPQQLQQQQLMQQQQMGQGGGMSNMVKSGLGNFLKQELAPKPQPQY